MGGIILISAAVIGYLVSHITSGDGLTASGLLIIALGAGLGLIGFADDFIKIYRQTSLGLRLGPRVLGVVIFSVTFAWLSLHFRGHSGLTPGTDRLSFLRNFGPAIGLIAYTIWVLVMVFCASFAVRSTDGFDGMAGGSVALFMAAYVFIGATEAELTCQKSGNLHCYAVRDPLDAAILAAAVLGACGGFLWWNVPPAKIFLGDVGGLALGGMMAGLGIITHTELLAVVIAGLNTLVLLSVLIQEGSFRLTGRRIFRMAPLQYHFQLMGWPETLTTMRFLLVGGLYVAFGLTLFYLNS